MFIVDSLSNGIAQFSVWVLPLLFAITMHEAAHAYMSSRFGDPTAKMKGRVTLNPIRHIDPFGTLLLPGILLITHAPVLFGWAKPVPVNFRNLRPFRKGMIMVALAGPATNLALAFVSALLLHLPVLFGDPADPAVEWVWENLRNSINVNLILAVLNMLPIPPLDGGRVATFALPPALGRHLARLERYGMAILLGLAFVPHFLGFDLFSYLIGAPARALGTVILTLTGWI
ncbi:peptidase M48 [Alphaproteobacteria bacterium]|nr:peptidase M48 [Alphaproteobacteria bacterium]